jgi:smad nuclear-interacting protein 1
MEDRGERHRHRPRSRSEDSEEDRYRRHLRRERDDRDTDSYRSYHDSGQGHKRSEQRDKYKERDQKRRRSRSPAEISSSSRNRERSPRYSIREERSPKTRGSRDSESRFIKDNVDRQVTAKKSGPLPSQAESFSMTRDPSMALVPTEDRPPQEKQKPNFAPTGLLAAASNTIAHADGTSIVLKYHEPPEARKPPPKDQWKLFVFKGSDILETIELSLRTCWLVGRELSVVDLPAEHPSISKQHAVIQFRWIEKKNEFGDRLGRVRPYLIDLESANGTKLNKEIIPSSRYLELRDKDMIQFGDSTREYVLMLPPKD